MYWLLNSAVIAVDGDGYYSYTTIIKAQALAWLLLHQDELISRIGYPDNVNFIYALSGVRVALSRDESKLGPGDEALVIRPRYRLQDPGSKKTFKPDPNDFVFGLLVRLETKPDASKKSDD